MPLNSIVPLRSRSLSQGEQAKVALVRSSVALLRVVATWSFLLFCLIAFAHGVPVGESLGVAALDGTLNGLARLMPTAYGTVVDQIISVEAQFKTMQNTGWTFLLASIAATGLESVARNLVDPIWRRLINSSR